MGKKKYRNPATGENTVIGEGTVIEGNIVADSMIIRIDGQVNGSVNTKGDLVVGPKGEIKGDVTASSLILAGKLTGNADIVNKIEIEAKGELLGDINTQLLAMDETAILQGRVNMIQHEEAADDNKNKSGETE